MGVILLPHGNFENLWGHFPKNILSWKLANLWKNCRNRTIIILMIKKCNINTIIYYIICYLNVLNYPNNVLCSWFWVPSRIQLKIITKLSYQVSLISSKIVQALSGQGAWIKSSHNARDGSTNRELFYNPHDFWTFPPDIHISLKNHLYGGRKLLEAMDMFMA